MPAKMLPFYRGEWRKGKGHTTKHFLFLVSFVESGKRALSANTFINSVGGMAFGSNVLEYLDAFLEK